MQTDDFAIIDGKRQTADGLLASISEQRQVSARRRTLSWPSACRVGGNEAVEALVSMGFVTKAQSFERHLGAVITTGLRHKTVKP